MYGSSNTLWKLSFFRFPSSVTLRIVNIGKIKSYILTLTGTLTSEHNKYLYCSTVDIDWDTCADSYYILHRLKSGPGTEGLWHFHIQTFITLMSYAKLLKLESHEHRVCGMHKNMAIQIRNANRTRDASTYTKISSNLRKRVLDTFPDKTISIGIVYKSI